MSIGKSKSKSTEKPMFKGTPFSSVSAGTVNLDPTIRQFQDQGLSSAQTGQSNLSAATGAFGASMGDLRSKLFGNMDPYMQARVNPFKQAQAQAFGDVTQSMTRRGLGGSPFLQQAQTNVNTDYGRQIADQGALATNESIQAASGIDQLVLQAKQAEAQGNMGLADYLKKLAQDRYGIEWGALTQSGGTKQTGSSASANIGKAIASIF